MHVTLFHPGTGRRWTVGPGALLGRGPSREVQINDPRVSSTHAEVAVRDGALVLLNRGLGGLRVDGQVREQVELFPGLRVELAPGLIVNVEAIMASEGIGGEPPTAGRQTLMIEVGESVVVVRHAGRTVEIGDTPGQLLGALLRSPEPRAPWYRIAEQTWPDAGARIRADWERNPAGHEMDHWNHAQQGTFRNKFDKALGRLRERVGEFRQGGLVTIISGELQVHLLPDDRCLHRARLLLQIGVGSDLDQHLIQRVIATCMSVATVVAVEQGSELESMGMHYAPGRRWLAEYLADRFAELGLSLPLMGADAGGAADLTVHLPEPR